VRPPRDLARTGAEVVLPDLRLTRRVRSLEAAVAENAALEVSLAAQVGRLEAALVPVLEAAVGPVREPRDDR
jgi:hypothetical protein